MKKLLYLGAGVMSSSISIPPTDNGLEVTLVGSPLDRKIIEKLQNGQVHPKLDNPLSDKVKPIFEEDLNRELFEHADAILIGVNCAGVDWALEKIRQAALAPKILLMITKGLFDTGSKLSSLPEYVRDELGFLARDTCLIGIGGPCIARELANRVPTLTVFGSNKNGEATKIRKAFQTKYYRILLDDDLQGIEINAALKNFMAIGVAASWTLFPESIPTPSKPRNMNPTAFCFNQAVSELRILTEWLGGNAETAIGPAGLGDLFVTVNAGRNSKMGLLLGEGLDYHEIVDHKLKGETIEGAVVAHNLYAPLKKAIQNKDLYAKDLPLTLEILSAVVEKRKYRFNLGQYY